MLSGQLTNKCGKAKVLVCAPAKILPCKKTLMRGKDENWLLMPGERKPATSYLYITCRFNPGSPKSFFSNFCLIFEYVATLDP